MTTTSRPLSGSGTPRVPVGRAQAAQAQLPHAARARRGGTHARMSFPVRAKPFITPMHRGRLPTCSRCHARVDGLERPSGRTASSCGITPSTIMSPTRSHPGSRTEIRLGARAHNTRTINRAHAPPANRSSTLTTPDPALDAGPLHRRSCAVPRARVGDGGRNADTRLATGP